MNNIVRQGFRVVAAGLGLIALLIVAAPRPARAASPATPEAVIRTWRAPARAAAAAMLEKYGPPSQFDRRKLVWFNNGTWKRTIVDRAEKDYLQQTIAYLVPRDKLKALERFSRRLHADSTAGELTFASNSESTNLLALNLADEIVVGSKTPAQAQAFFAKSSRLAASGKSSPYRENLRFDVDNSRYMAPTGADR